VRPGELRALLLEAANGGLTVDRVRRLLGRLPPEYAPRGPVPPGKQRQPLSAFNREETVQRRIDHLVRKGLLIRDGDKLVRKLPTTISLDVSATLLTETETPSTAPDEPEEATPDMPVIDRLAEWIFTQRDRGLSSENLYREACRKAEELGTFKKADFTAAYGQVYRTQAWRRPAPGWPLQPAFAARLEQERKSRKSL
jgi:hypothetical protein